MGDTAPEGTVRGLVSKAGDVLLKLAMAVAIIWTGIVVLWAAYRGYKQADSCGWLTHRRQAQVVADSSNWLVGETKECTSFPLPAEKDSERPVGYAVDAVYCDKGASQHETEVRFFGRIIQPEYAVVRWNCARDQEGFACYELGGFSVPLEAPPSSSSQTPPIYPMYSYMVRLSDGSLRPSQKGTLNGDLRPFWNVEGRMTNQSDKVTIVHVKIRVTLSDDTDKSTIDGADLDLEIDIPPEETRGFSREVQLLPVANGHASAWSWEVASVEGKILPSD